jgi:hypothetical protein
VYACGRLTVTLQARDWVQSDEPLDTPISESTSAFSLSAGCPCVSAGHPKHEYTSPCAIESVFAFLCDKLSVKYVVSAGRVGVCAD